MWSRGKVFDVVEQPVSEDAAGFEDAGDHETESVVVKEAVLGVGIADDVEAGSVEDLAVDAFGVVDINVVVLAAE